MTTRTIRPISHAATRTLPVRQVQTDWFTPWFNSPYYHLLYRNRDEAEAKRFVERLVAHLSLGRESDVLDLACGRGRHAVLLAESGADVTGVDIAPESIAYARQHENARLRFRVGDMRKPFGEGEFTEVLNLFTSFGYFGGEADNLAVLRNAARALQPGGRLVIDFLNAEKVARMLVPQEIRYAEGVRFRLGRRIQDGYIVKDIHVRDASEEHHFQERVQALRLADFCRFFRTVGFELEEVFGDYALRPFDAETSDRLILIARKSA
ncbi:MAG TPA: class I SAM-dependent methyltransferase [Rhodothermales bacterium]